MFDQATYSTKLTIWSASYKLSSKPQTAAKDMSTGE